MKNEQENEEEQRIPTDGGLGITSVLLIIFVILKLLKLIEWSWWWVVSPLWIWMALVVILLILAIIFEVKM